MVSKNQDIAAIIVIIVVVSSGLLVVFGGALFNQQPNLPVHDGDYIVWSVNGTRDGNNVS